MSTEDEAPKSQILITRELEGSTSIPIQQYSDQKKLIQGHWMYKKLEVTSTGGIFTEEMKQEAIAEALLLYPKVGIYKYNSEGDKYEPLGQI